VSKRRNTAAGVGAANGNVSRTVSLSRRSSAATGALVLSVTAGGIAPGAVSDGLEATAPAGGAAGVRSGAAAGASCAFAAGGGGRGGGFGRGGGGRPPVRGGRAGGGGLAAGGPGRGAPPARGAGGRMRGPCRRPSPGAVRPPWRPPRRRLA